MYRRAMLWVLHMSYQIETYTLCCGWVNIWADDDVPVIFDTYAAALAELAEYLAELAHAVKIGHLDDYNPDDYRVMEVVL
jgi:hypothetical protein